MARPCIHRIIDCLLLRLNNPVWEHIQRANCICLARNPTLSSQPLSIQNELSPYHDSFATTPSLSHPRILPLYVFFVLIAYCSEMEFSNLTIALSTLSVTYVFFRLLLSYTQDKREPPAVETLLPFISPILGMGKKNAFYVGIR